MAESRGRKTLYPAPVTNHATSRGVGGGGPPGPRVRFPGGLPRNRHGAYGAFAVRMQSRRDADSPDGAPARDRRPVLPVGASQRDRPAPRGETAQRQPRTSAGTAWNADLWAVLPVGPGTRWPPASARRIGKWRCGSPPGTYPTGRTSQMSAFPSCKSLRRVAWALRRAPSPNCTFVTGRVCGPTRSWTFRCPPGSDAGHRPPPGELAGAPWRKRVGIEPTIPGTNPESTDLKSAEAARPHALPVRCSGLPRTAGRDPGGADGDRTRDLVNAIHARSQLRHSPSPGHPERTECIALGSASRPLEWEPRCGRQDEAACPFRMILGRVATLNVTM